MIWDIFCQVIDNFGDIGVCWRLSADLAARGEQVRLWVDDPSALAWMAPQGQPGVQLRHWTQPLDLAGVTDSDVWIEAFGCEIAPEFIASYADSTSANGTKPVWINLEYLSAEAYVERCHALPSPVRSGPAMGMQKWFFYPGFTGHTGGLPREPDVLQRQAAFDAQAWLAALWPQLQHADGATVERQAGEHTIALFCYEPPALADLLEQLAGAPTPTRLLVTAGRATRAVQALFSNQKGLQPRQNLRGQLSISYLPTLTQHDFDHLLWAADCNFVRGEDSLVRALWAGKPFVWQIYPQDDAAHHDKLEAFLDMAQASASLRQFHRVWNGLQAGPLPADLSPPALREWTVHAQALRTRLLQLPDLAGQLIRFQAKTR